MGKCPSCQYFVESKGPMAGITGRCHRHAPQIDCESHAGIWPVVSVNFGCGEHEPRPAPLVNPEAQP